MYLKQRGDGPVSDWDAVPGTMGSHGADWLLGGKAQGCRGCVGCRVASGLRSAFNVKVGSRVAYASW